MTAGPPPHADSAVDSAGLAHARDKMYAAGVDPLAIEVFSSNYRRLEAGESGMISEASIAPREMEALWDQGVDSAAGLQALHHTAVLKLNGGLGTSMGMDKAKSLLIARDDLTFLDIIVRQILAIRSQTGARLPLMVMNSFRTSDDTFTALSGYPPMSSELPWQLLQNKVPKLRADDLHPVEWPHHPELEWCPPGHGDLYTALHSAGLLETLLERGYTQLFVSNSDNLGAIPDVTVAGWFASSGSPFAIEAVRRTANDKKGGHFATRLSDGRVILRETAQTLPEDQAALADLSRHRYASTNNLWIDIASLKAELDRRHGVLSLPLIKNAKTVDPADSTTTEVIQVENAMGAAIELFAGATTIEVGRNRFIPVKTTNELMLLRSDCYKLDSDYVLRQIPEHLPTIELGKAYKLARDFDHRFPVGVPSLSSAHTVAVRGDWVFGADVKLVGDLAFDEDGGTVPDGAVLGSIPREPSHDGSDGVGGRSLDGQLA